MALPTVDEIRERARELFYARLPPEECASATTPEDYELKESGLWAEAQRELMAREHRKMEEELGRWEEMSEPEKAELRQRVESFGAALEGLKRAMEEAEEKMKAPPPAIEIKPRFTIGERVKHDVYGEGVVRSLKFDEKRKVYEDLVEFGGGKAWVPETELWAVYAAPPGAKPSAPLGFVCPKCGKPLMPVTEIVWTEGEEVRTTRVPEAELVFMCVAGEAERFRGLQSSLKLAGERLRAAREAVKRSDIRGLAEARREAEAAGKDFAALTREAGEFAERIKAACPFAGLYFKVRRGKLVGPVPRSEVLREVLRPVRPPGPAVPAMRRIWPFRGGPALPEEELRKGMSDEEIKDVFAKRGIDLTLEGLKFFKQRYGLEG